MSGADRWQAVLERQPGAFVYAVRSTGVYCRPTCPSRRPRREQVVFYDRPDQAERAGFRPCRRCRPAQDSDAEMVGRVCRAIEEHPDGRPALATLGREVGMSPYHLQRKFKRLTGVTPRQYAEALRVGRLKAGLQEGHDVTRAMYDAGYGSSSRLYEQAQSLLGMTPGAYRRGGAGMHIAYTIVDSALGRLLVAGTGRGVSAVYLGDADARLEAELRREYPLAELARDAAGVGDWVRKLVSHLDGGPRKLDLPLDVQATAFQWRVWEQLRAIPYGATRSYTQVARELGRPTATRAVARACATNPVSIVVPCHRVLRQDGHLGGYRWGLERKRKLLEKEKPQMNADERR